MGSKASIETRNARESTSKHGDDGYLVAKQRENEVAEVTVGGRKKARLVNA